MNNSQNSLNRLKLNIRLKRVELKLSQQKLADKVGVSKTTIVAWEKNPPEGFTDAHLANLATSLNCTKAWLLDHEPNKVKNQSNRGIDDSTPQGVDSPHRQDEKGGAMRDNQLFNQMMADRDSWRDRALEAETQLAHFKKGGADPSK